MMNRKSRMRTSSFIFALIIVLTTNAFAFASTSTNPLSSKAHTYAVVPGTEEWANLTPDMRLASCHVTQTEVSNMTTAALVETVINYPYLVNIFAYNSILLGIEMVSYNFPGIKELLSRPDAVTELKSFNDKYNSNLVTTSKKAVNVYIETFLAILDDAETRVGDLYPSTSSPITVYTPNNKPVRAYRDMDWAGLYNLEQTVEDGLVVLFNNAKADELEIDYAAAFPNATKIGNYTPRYNCFAYAWKPAVYTNRWLAECEPYITGTSSYYQTTAASGNIVTYRAQNGTVTHAGIVSNVNGSSATSIYAVSKWGFMGIYNHSLRDCPYYIDASNIQYWALRPQYAI